MAKNLGKASGTQDVLRTWLLETSVVGLSHASRSQPLWLRVAWGLVFALGTTVTMTQVYNVFVTFLDYPSSTTVTLTHATHIRFPAVTVCNFNRVHCYNVEEVLEHNTKCNPGNGTTVLNTLYNTSLIWEEFRAFAVFTGCEKDDSNRTSSLFSHATTPEIDFEGNQVDVVVNIENRFLQEYSSLPAKLRKDIGHSFKDLIRSCSFKGQDCRNESLFLQDLTPKYGNCYTFNHILNKNDPEAGQRMMAVTGNQHGLQLTLNLDQNEYMKSGLTQAEGVRVAVSDPLVMIHPDVYGLDVLPNTRTSIALRHKEVSRMPHPFSSNCTKGWEETFYRNLSETTYSLLECQRFCYFFMIYDTCDCVHPLFMSTSSYLDQFYDKSVCQISIVKTDSNVTETAKRQYHCIQATFDKLDNGILKCEGCGVACDEEDYAMFISTSKWPSKTFEKSAYENYIEPYIDYKELAEHNISEVELENNVASNLVHLDIFYETLDVEKISESATYTYGTLLTDLGGALSLMLGISMAMIFEFVFVVIQIVYTWGKKITT